MGGIVAWDIFLHIQVDSEKVATNPYKNFIPADYPILASVLFPAISAQGAMIMDASSHVVLFMKNPDVRFSPASTTKIMTAYIGLEYYDLENVLTAWNAIDTEGDGLGLVSGERLTFGDLLYASLVPSANDAAYTIATNYPGGVAAFIKRMNEISWDLHMYNTSYVDPHGLDDDGDFTTPRDLLTITSIAMKDPIFRRIVSTKQVTITDLSKTHLYQLKSTNKLLGMYGINGVKTGTTQEAGQVLVTSFLDKGHTLYLVVMHSDDRFSDTLSLVRFIRENLSYQDMRPALR